MTEILSRRALNRSLLARQLLLERAEMPVPKTIEHLVGLQAQSPGAPYFGLWTRLADLDPLKLSKMIETRRAVRIALMRSTIHLVTSRDCLRLRPVMKGPVERSLGGYRKQLEGVDRDALLRFAEELYEEKPFTGIELEAELSKRWPRRDAHALAMAVRCWLPLVQVPPRALWGRSGPAAHTTAQRWLGEPPAGNDDPAPAIRRYLATFGPASVKDVQTWSGLTGVTEALEKLRRKLVTFRDEEGVELFDVPEAPFPDPDTPAPPRFVPEYDNVLLSHYDRSRVIADAYRTRIFTKGGLLVDGFAVGRWWIKKRRAVVELQIELFEKLSKSNRSLVEAEALDLLTFAAPEATHEIAGI